MTSQEFRTLCNRIFTEYGFVKVGKNYYRHPGAAQSRDAGSGTHLMHGLPLTRQTGSWLTESSNQHMSHHGNSDRFYRLFPFPSAQ